MKTSAPFLLFSALLAASFVASPSLASNADSLALTTPVGKSSYVTQGPTLAQALVDGVHKKHPKIVSVVLHSLLPNGKEYATIAAIDRNKVGGQDNDLDIGVEERRNMYVQPVVADNYAETVVLVPVKDATGATLKAAWEFVLPTTPDTNEATLLTKVIEMRDALAKEIPSGAALFEPPPAS